MEFAVVGRDVKIVVQSFAYVSSYCSPPHGFDRRPVMTRLNSPNWRIEERGFPDTELQHAFASLLIPTVVGPWA